jgi:hypothetical protein
MYWFRRTTCPTLTNLKLKLLTRYTHQLFVRLLALKPVRGPLFPSFPPPILFQCQSPLVMEHDTGWLSLPTVLALERGSHLLLFLFLGRDVRLYRGTVFVNVAR